MGYSITQLSLCRSIVLSSILTHKPSLRAATQTFLLRVTLNLTDIVRISIP